jgi:hypothetical protein
MSAKWGDVGRILGVAIDKGTKMDEIRGCKTINYIDKHNFVSSLFRNGLVYHRRFH